MKFSLSNISFWMWAMGFVAAYFVVTQIIGSIVNMNVILFLIIQGQLWNMQRSITYISNLFKHNVPTPLEPMEPDMI